jgi:competence protein ComEC
LNLILRSGRQSGPAAVKPAGVRIAAGFLAGVIVVQHFPALPDPWLVLPAGLLLALAIRFRRALPAAFLAGLIWAAVYGQLRLSEELPTAGRLEAVVEGQVLSLPEAMDRGVRFDFGIARTVDPAGTELPGHVRVSWYDEAAAPKAGETWRLRLSLRRPRGMRNPGGFDYEQWLFAEGIRAVGYVRESGDNRRIADASILSPESWRQGLDDRLRAVLAESPVAGLVRALTLGADDGISRGQWEVLRRTGTAHLIAISGSHIGLIAGVAFVLARAGWSRLGARGLSPPAVAAWAGGAVALFYSALAGFAIPTQRALVMIAVAMGAVLLQRNMDPVHLLAVALVAVAAYDPLAVMAPGFWLSFGAVALIAFVLSGRPARPRGLVALLRMNWATALGLAPLLLVFFRQVSLVSPLANLLAVPVLGTLLIPVCLAGALLLPIVPAAGGALIHLGEFILARFWPVLEWLSAWPAAQWTHAEPPAWTLIPAGLGVLLLLAPRGIPARWLGLVLLLPAATFQPERPAPGAFRLILLDVGQGLAAVVETRGRSLVFDTGARLGPNFDMGSAVIEPYLRHRGIDALDALIVS